MRRTLILTALGATTLSIGLGIGATLASASTARPIPPVTTTITGDGMHDGAGMTQMMGSTCTNGQMDAGDMSTMDAGDMTAMDAGDMTAMHNAMHTGKRSATSDHPAHHQGTQP